ncbi:glycine C-acetyltransferase [Flavobacteriales bacterium]|jgi:glycine C-acetyltransferase|nr:glycine C-acetyltransferase [Flavobacteriales bacterium]|tara:strand:+ start:1434 stop:2624 length:1191 start_codon:yes stop_codon:yes gene_type:complete
MYESLKNRIISELDDIKKSGRYKSERQIESPQCTKIKTEQKNNVINFCANNYLGLAANKEIQNAAKQTIESHGFGLASVRFICGTQDIHKKLENEISDFLGTEDTILYAAAFDANGGLFEPLFDSRDAIVSDSLNHASLIDGIRLCKAERFRYKNNDMIDLEKQLKLTKNFRSRVIVTDGVFSMDGTIAQLDNIYKLAKKYNSLIFVDDCHATGFIGKNGRGSHEYNDVLGKIDIITGTLGKALGGGSGGFSSGKKEIIELLRQKSRPYLFSNTLAPSIVGASIKALEIIKKDNSLIKKLKENTIYFREKISKIGFEIKGKNHPIVPIMIYDDIKAKKIADYLYENDIYVVSFSYPVVPKGLSRIRIQISSAHTKIEMDKALKLLKEAGLKFGVLN